MRRTGSAAGTTRVPWWSCRAARASPRGRRRSAASMQCCWPARTRRPPPRAGSRFRAGTGRRRASLSQGDLGCVSSDSRIIGGQGRRGKEAPTGFSDKAVRYGGRGWQRAGTRNPKLRVFNMRKTNMRSMRWIMVVIVAWILVLAGPARTATPPPVELVDVYHGGVDLSRYWVSEKFDGVRGYWNGHQMLTRGGTVVHVPAWFTKDLPDTPMDGELWVGYGQFSRASAIVRTAGADDPAWHEVT